MIAGIIKKIRNLSFIRNHLSIRQFIKFAISGGIFTIVDFSIYILLTRFFLFFSGHYLWANFIGMAVGATGNFILNKNWTFRNKEKKVFVQYIKFWIVALGGMVVYQYFFYFFVSQLNLYDLLAKAIVAVLVMLIRFILNKYWTFTTLK